MPDESPLKTALKKMASGEKPELKTDDAPENTDETTTTDQPDNKTLNLGNLRKGIQERDTTILTLQGELEQARAAASKSADPKFTKLIQAIETEFEDDPEKLLTSYNELRETSKTWEEKLAEKEALLERSAFEKSEAYHKNIAKPISDAEALLKGVIKKDSALYSNLLKNFVYDKDGKVVNGSLSTDEIMALDELLDGVDGVRPERVQNAIENLREKFHQANDYNTNYRARMAQEEESRQAALAQENLEKAGLAKIARGTAVKQAAGKFTGNADLKRLLGEEFVNGLGRAVAGTVERMIEQKQAPTMEQMALNQMKAILFDKLEAEGALSLLVEALETSEEHSTASLGAKGDRNAPQQKETRSAREILAEKAGLNRDTRF